MSVRGERSGYEKGEDTRKTILETALMEFGEARFSAVTTRQIAAAAGVNLPAIKYYFGGKEGLYLACAEAAIDHHRLHAQAIAETADARLQDAIGPDQARALLKQVFAGLRAMLEDSNDSQTKLAFISREMNEPGPAYELLYTRLWRPGVEIVARLIAAAKGQAEAAADDRLDALLLLSSLSVVTIGRTVTMRTMGWSALGPDRLSAVFASIDRRIDALGAG